MQAGRQANRKAGKQAGGPAGQQASMPAAGKQGEQGEQRKQASRRPGTPTQAMFVSITALGAISPPNDFLFSSFTASGLYGEGGG